MAIKITATFILAAITVYFLVVFHNCPKGSLPKQLEALFGGATMGVFLALVLVIWTSKGS